MISASPREKIYADPGERKEAHTPLHPQLIPYPRPRNHVFRPHPLQTHNPTNPFVHAG
jgi:hypothetical protein